MRPNGANSAPVVIYVHSSYWKAGDKSQKGHLPDFFCRQEFVFVSVLEHGQLVPAKFAITPRMLMSHSSGLYYGTIEGGPFTGGATGRGARTTLEEHSKSLAAKPLKFHPGEGYSYGTSIDVLGRYIEAVAGKPLDEVLHQRILSPLRMTSTDFWVHPKNAGRICQIYKHPPRRARARTRCRQASWCRPSSTAPPTYRTFKSLVNEAAGVPRGRAPEMFGDDSAVRGSPDPARAAVRGSPDPAPGTTDRTARFNPAWPKMSDPRLQQTMTCSRISVADHEFPSRSSSQLQSRSVYCHLDVRHSRG
jgi:CubicO group peptidase (beta-lactamase class C family)